MTARQIVANLYEVLSLLWHAAPRAMCLALASNLVVGAIPALLLYINAQLIGRLSSNAGVAAVMALVFSYFLLGGCHDGLNAISSFVVDTLEDAAKVRLKGQVNAIVSTYPDLSIHEDAQLRETALLAAAASDEIGDLVQHLYAVCLGTVMMTPILVITAHTAWWIPLLMLAGMTPAVYCRARAERESWDVRERHAGTFNALRIVERVLTQPEYAKDLRVYRMQQDLLAGWRHRYKTYLDSMRRVRTRNALKLAGTSIAASGCLAIPLYVVVAGCAAGRFTIAELAFLLGALVQLKDGLAAIIYNVGDVLRVSYAARPLRALTAAHLAARQRDRASQPTPDGGGIDGVAAPAASSVSLRGVSLHYRDAARPALVDVDLEIAPRESIAVVGENGAGKTSLLKLLSGLYQPTAGTLRWATEPAPPRVVGLFQDFARFPFDVIANLGMPDERDGSRARAHLRAVGLDSLSTRLTQPLTSEMADGVDLSGGQWQRLAIARVLAHADEADLLFFDEPTSALDPEFEAEIMRLILRIARRRSTVIVSHRLALTRFVDRIVVLEQGRIVETGSHDALLARDGKYARMFRSQAQFYQAQPDTPM